MAHVQAAGHVRRRDHHRERFTGSLRVGMKGPLVLPDLLPAGLRANRVIGLGQFGHGRNTDAGHMVSKDALGPPKRDDQTASMPLIHGPALQRSERCDPTDA